ncbi:MAG: VOC family protein [Pseudomonadales bacterium]|jgi:predicted enzyme related to lactoylglutathione lyase|nr:VOC family protein [Pseudomonadales bacterium]
MSTPFISRTGGILSADIAVPDHEREQRFYARVLTTGDTPLWRDDLMNARGIPVIGLGERTADLEHLPLQWMPHIQVDDVAASVEQALAHGGRELMHGRDDAGNSQYAVLADPNGAAFGIIPVVPPEMLPPAGDDAEGAALTVGCIAWVDLTVPDAAATRDFYQQVVGWTPQDVEMKDGIERYADFNMLAGDGNPGAGICHARGVNASLPPTWMLYLPVSDLAESLRRVTTEGGRIVHEARKSDDELFYAVIEDPVGVTLALMPG